MAYFDLDNRKAVNFGHFSRTIFMTGVVAVAAWELWGRHFAPYLYGQELAAAEILRVLFGLKSRLVAEGIYFAVAIPAIPLLYLILWQPLVERIAFIGHWTVAGLSFGIALFLLANSILITVADATLQAMLFRPSASGWFIGALMIGLAAAGFVQLRKLGRKII